MTVKDMKLRIPAELKDQLAARAARNDRSLAAEALNILKAAMRKDENQTETA